MTLAYSRVENGKLFLKNVLVHNTELGYSFEEAPRASHAFPTVGRLVDAKQLSSPVVSAIYNTLYCRRPQESNYTAFDPKAGDALAAATGPASMYTTFNPTAAHHKHSSTAPKTSNYEQFTAVASTGATGTVHTVASPAASASYSRFGDLQDDLNHVLTSAPKTTG